MSSSRSRSFLTAVVSASGRAGAGRRGVRRGLPVALAAALLVLAVGIGVIAPSPAAADACSLNGDGTSGSPFQVGSADDLAKVGVGACGLTTTTFYLQTSDITLTAPAGGGSNHVPIGASGAEFRGTFDGGGFTIDGLVIAGSNTNVGLFAATREGAVITNVRLVNGSVTGWQNVGGLIGKLGSGTVSRSSFSGGVTASGGSLGGLIGLADGSGSVEASFTTGTVSGSISGGLIGTVDGFTSVSDSYSTSTVTGGFRIGGLIGVLRYRPCGDGSCEGRVSRSYAAGPVIVTGTSTLGHLRGGLIGERDTTQGAGGLPTEEAT